MPSVQPPSRNEHLVNTSKKLLKNRNWTSPVIRYFTWKLEFVSNNLWMIFIVSTDFYSEKVNARWKLHWKIFVSLCLVLNYLWNFKLLAEYQNKYSKVTYSWRYSHANDIATNKDYFNINNKPLKISHF